MQGSAWVALFRRVPEAQHDCLVIKTISGAEIVIQRIVCLEHDFIAAIGRLGGSTEQGKLVLIPYDQITYLAVNRMLEDSETQQLLGFPVTGISDAGRKALPSDGAAVVKTPERPTGDQATLPIGLEKPVPPSRAELLVRLRERREEATRQSGT